jgi:demethylmenaquinone methyltransferase/2-methoxy-6-polyprenyl-1,4-benzoquinol methylase
MSAKHPPPDSQEQVNFGYQKVSATEKTERVGAVFRAVAKRYDVMNDIMSFGSHRIFKRMVLHMSGIRQGHKVLDLAGGTGDMAALFAGVVGPEGAVVLADLNEDMMRVGRDRLLDDGLTQISFCRAPAESLPFQNQQFDCACISFGLRNFT